MYNIRVMGISKREFEEHRQYWSENFYHNFRLLDIDFEMYMLMSGLSKEEYNRLNNMEVLEEKEL